MKADASPHRAADRASERGYGPSIETDRVRFVLLSKPRSGTSFFMEALAKHPKVGGYGELLLPGVEGWSNWPKGAKDRPFYATYLRDRGLLRSRVARHTRLFPYLDYIYEPRREFRAIGFKLMYGHTARYPEVLAYLQARSVRVIHLVRSNLLDLFLSRQAVGHRRFMHSRSPEERELITLRVDVSVLRRELSRIEMEQRIAAAVVRSLRLAVHAVTYESLLLNDQQLDATLAFLGVQRSNEMDLSPIMLKQAPTSQRMTVQNFDEVAAVLAGTRFSAFLRP